MGEIEQAILMKLGVIEATGQQWDILVACFRHLKEIFSFSHIDELRNLNQPVLSHFQKLSTQHQEYLNESVPTTPLSVGECQVEVQKTLEFNNRKAFAAYFTNNDGLAIMEALVRYKRQQSPNKKYRICDPFMGGARTLTAAIKTLGKDNIGHVLGVEPFFLSAFVGFTAIANALEGDIDKISVFVGDSFQVIPQILSPLWNGLQKAVDIILTNPPFTRWHYLSKNQRELVLRYVKNAQYSSYLTRKEAGLQIFSMFLCDQLLAKGGMIFAVLPLSTFYTIGGAGLKSLLQERYTLYALVESIKSAAFSEDSGFKEVILVAEKSTQNILTLFTKSTMDPNNLGKYVFNRNEKSPSGKYYDIKALPEYLNNNWLALFEENEIESLINTEIQKGIEANRIGIWKNIYGSSRIIRGFEMYGPDFFFLPNKYWGIEKETDSNLLIRSNNEEHCLSIPKDYLVKALRKPAMYYSSIQAQIDSYALNLPRISVAEFPLDVQTYIAWGKSSSEAEPAIKNFGDYWYSHIHHCIQTKNPFANVFVGDKVDLAFKKRSSFGLFSPEKVSASKNFYLILTDNEKIAKFFVAWLNSSLFLGIIILLSRKISQTWTRLLENDYLELPIIDFNKITHVDGDKILKAIDVLLKKDLPPIWAQMESGERKSLDIAIANACGIANPQQYVDDLHKFLLKYSQSLEGKESD